MVRDRLGAVRAALLEWYDRNRRDLPWRAAPGSPADPYAVWVSEVMLQQTRVETVRPYFERWMGRFPDLQALAAAEVDDVLKSWEGLGYYSRARNLQRAVREVLARYGGEVPRDIATLRSLPGVGRYTAGAIASIAFGQAAPLVDGNVRRVFARWLDQADPAESELWAHAAALVDGVRPGDLNQSLMELGATVCLPRSPRCGACPLTGWCLSNARGTVEMRPAARIRKPLPQERVAVAIATAEGRVLVERRRERGRLGGLWEFPGRDLAPGEDAAARATALVAELGSVPARDPLPLGSVAHAFTHVRVTYEAFLLSLDRAPDGLEGRPDIAWHTSQELEQIAMPRAQRRIAERWQSVLEGERLLDVG